jgi:DNA-binding transcriptional LysR family regulator
LRDLRRTDLGLLAVLDALLEERSVTRAAVRLAVTQPTVSGMLARLRKVFDDPLFVRTQRGLLPTPRALAVAPQLKQWLNDAGALVAGQTFEPSSARWTTAVAANDYIQSALIVPFLARLRAGAPHARVVVRPASTDRVADTLASGELDLNITGTTETPSYDLPSRLLYEERYVGVVRQDHPLDGQRAVSLDTFCSYPHVLVSPTEGRFAGPTDQALARLGRARRVVLSVPGFLVLPDILQTDDLIAVVPERVLRGRLAGLRTFTPPVAIPTFAVVALWHPRLHKDPAHRWFRELLAATAMDLRTARSTPV